MRQELLDDYKRFIMPTYAPAEVAFVRGDGVYLYDDEGKEYIDFISGVAVNSLGYNHPKLNSELNRQIGQILHTSNLFVIPEQIKLAKKLSTTFGDGKCFFCNSGAEANEGAIKLARKYSKRKFGELKFEFITMKNSFHGRTLAAITATGQPKYQVGFEPLPLGFIYADFNNIESIEKAATENTCAVLIEPIQGEGGVNVASQSFWDELQSFCSV